MCIAFLNLLLYKTRARAHNISMNIRELLNESMIEIGAELSTKDEALDRLIELQRDGGAVRNPLSLSREIRARETLGTSAVSMRVAIPSVRHRGARKTSISALTVSDGVSYDSPDKRKVRLMFMISGKDGTDEYIEVKARLMHLLMDSEFTARLCSAKSREEFLRLIDEREKVRYAKPKPDKRYDCSKFLEKNYDSVEKRRLFFERIKNRFKH